MPFNPSVGLHKDATHDRSARVDKTKLSHQPINITDQNNVLGQEIPSSLKQLASLLHRHPYPMIIFMNKVALHFFSSLTIHCLLVIRLHSTVNPCLLSTRKPTWSSQLCVKLILSVINGPNVITYRPPDWKSVGPCGPDAIDDCQVCRLSMMLHL